MIARLMIYATTVALLLAMAAWAIERVAIWRGLPRRLCWAAAMMLSVAIPVVGIVMPTTAPPPPPLAVTPDVPLHRPRAPVVTRSYSPAAAIRTSAFETQHPSPLTLEQSLSALWLLGSCGLLAGYSFLATRLRLATRNWRPERIDSQPVWITDCLGPAVYGFINPIILLPEWLLQADEKELAAALAHERSHLAARDPALLMLALVVIVLLPWNLPLWWQLRRLKFAIEVDCDGRVLNSGMTLRDYAGALLAIGERGSSTPMGAVALTEPASQLLQRIRIMTTELPKRGKATVVATVVLALACVGVAARTQAPTSLGALKASPWVVAPSDIDSLRKPPVDENPAQPRVEALVRATYPRIFQGTGASQPMLVSLFLNEDGSLYKSLAEEIAPRPYVTTSWKAFDDAGIDWEHRGPNVRLRLKGASGLPVDVIAWYLQPSPDPTRDVAIVRAKVKERYAALLDSADNSVLTVLMTEAGEIDRATVETIDDRSMEGIATTNHFGNRMTTQHFAVAGFPIERLGLVGATWIFKGHFNDDPDAKRIPVVYAWPRRSNEQVTKFEVLDRGAAAAANDNRDVDRLMAEHYFPDLYTHPGQWPRADPWILLDRQGKVLATGRRAVMSVRDIQLNIESRYPGIKTDHVQIVTLYGPQGQRPDVGFVWLAADSPVTDPVAADFSKQPDVLIYADVNYQGETFYTQMLALNFGSSGTTQCALRNPFGVVYLQLAVDASSSDAAAVRMRGQHLVLPADETIPEPVEAAWSPQSAPARAVYGGSSEAEISDTDGRKWNIVLHVERLRHSVPAKT